MSELNKILQGYSDEQCGHEKNGDKCECCEDERKALKPLFEEYAAQEVGRFTNQLKEQGFCPDQAFSSHVDDVHKEFQRKSK